MLSIVEINGEFEILSIILLACIEVALYDEIYGISR